MDALLQSPRTPAQDPWVALANEAIEWFWVQGRQRTGPHAISPVWLDEVYQRRGLFAAIAERRSGDRASIGLWGPSQSGKSTLISHFVDKAADAKGRGSALDWGKPTVFAARGNLPDGVVVFNRFNMGADSSGCVSRFVLCAESGLLSREYPVRLLLLSPEQILHGIAAGFAAECRGAVEHRWTADTLETWLDEQSGRKQVTASRSAFECLQEVVSVIDLLIRTGHPRFSQLNAGGKWDTSLRSRLLQSIGGLPDEGSVVEFAAKVLWNGHSALTGLWRRLTQFRARSLFLKTPLRCSMDVAALLVNIDSYLILKSPDKRPPKVQRSIQEAVRRLSWEDRGDHVCVGVGLANPLLTTEDEFGLLQGIVRELVIPLRREALDVGGAFVKLLEQADLVDFPGVAQMANQAAPALLNLDEVTQDDPRLFTEVLKRGKTASIMESYSQTFTLDGFVLLMRAGSFPSQPKPLHSGITAWWRFLDPSYDVYRKPLAKPPLPVFLNLTFFGHVVDQVAAGAATAGLAPLVKMFGAMDPIVDPAICTLLVTTYPHFVGGKIDAHGDAVERAVAQIVGDPGFGARCGSEASRTSVRQSATTPDGGVEHLCAVLAASVRRERIEEPLRRRTREAQRRLGALIAEQCPENTAGARRDEDIASVTRAIQQALQQPNGSDSDEVSDAAARVAASLRWLVDVSPEDLDPLPASAATAKGLDDYVETQIRKWVDSKRDAAGLEELGLGDWGLRARMLGYLAERADNTELADWIRDNLGSLDGENTRTARRCLAVHLSNTLCLNSRPSPHAPSIGHEVMRSLVLWADFEKNLTIGRKVKPTDSPHYTVVIQPALELLDGLSRGPTGARPPQPGDEQAVCLRDRALQLSDVAGC